MAASRPVRLSLYVHVPFCAATCRYCDFFSVPVDAGDAGERVQAAVVAETVAQLDRFLSRAPEVRFETIYVGGGTPSVLRPRVLKTLLDRLAGLGAGEWTVEANPESFDRQFLEACGRSGVTRLSVGLQTMDDRLLSVLGRPGTAADNRRAFEAIRSDWAGEASADLICGIPGQTKAGVREDAAAVSRSGFGHASLYSLTVEPDTPLAELVRSGAIVANGRDLDDELWLEGRASLEQAGFRHYEVSNFARPGKECRHNLRYWHLEPYLGIGPGAVSTLPPDLAEALTGARVPAPAVRLANPRDLGRFLAGADGPPGSPWGIETEAISGRDFVLETLMMGLRLTEGISAESFRRRFGHGLDELVPGVWQGWIESGYAEPQAGRLRMSRQGLLVLDPLLGALAGRLDESEPVAVQVSWPDRQAEY